MPLSISWGTAVVLVCAAASVGCTSREQVHPTRENLLPDAQVTTVIADDVASTHEQSLLLRRLKTAVPMHTVTHVGLEKPVPFGVVTSVAPISTGYLVFDSQKRGLHAFDADGRPHLSTSLGTRETAGRPRAFAVLQNGTIVIGGDRVLRSFAVDGAAFKELPSTPIERDVEELCVVGKSLFVRASAVGDSPLIGEYVNGRPTGVAFGPQYASKNEEIRTSLSHGHFACLPDAQVIVDGFNLVLPYLVGYSPSGKRLWTTRIENYKPARILEYTVDGEARVEHSQRGVHDILVTIAPLEPEHVLVQFARRTPNNKVPVIRSYILDAKTGRGSFASDTLPWVKAASATRLFTIDGVSFNKLNVFAW